MAKVDHTHFWYHYVDGVKILSFTPIEILKRLETFKIFPDDVLVAGHPRAGNNWISELIWLIIHGGDTEAALESYSTDRNYIVDFDFPTKPRPNMDTLEAMAPPRVIRTHLRPQHFENHMKDGGFKIIYILRNPKDMLVSFHHLMGPVYNYHGTWDEYFRLFIENKLPLENDFGTVIKWWEIRSRPEILFINYEEIKKNPHASIRKMADHLGKSLSDDKVNDIVEFATVTKMRKNVTPGSEFLIRKGEVGGWRECFSPEQEKIINEIMKEIEIKHGLKFWQE